MDDTMQEFQKQKEAMKLLDGADDKLEAAMLLADGGKNVDAIVITHYALYLCLKAALISKELKAHNHAELVELFKKNFVDTGALNPDFIALFERTGADKERFFDLTNEELSRDECSKTIDSALKLMLAEKRYLRKIFQTKSGTEKGRNIKVAATIITITAVAVIVVFSAHMIKNTPGAIRTIEGEDIVNSIGKDPANLKAVKQKAWWKNVSRGAQLFVAAGSPGEKIGVFVTVDQQARYDIYVYPTQAIDYGTVQFLFNDNIVGKPLDLYAPTVKSKGKVYIGRVDFRAGKNSFDIQVTDKNPRSSGYSFGIDKVVFEKIK